MAELWSRRTGPDSGPPLVLLHGMGATAEAFAPLVEVAARRWPGPAVAVDLPGHGRSAWAPPYTLERQCAAVVDAVPDLPSSVVVGHSLGGVVAVALAAGTGGAVPAAAVAVSVKALWSDEDLARAAAVAQKPRARFATEDEAAERFLKVAGLWGVADWPELRRSGIVRDGADWVLAQDPATNAFAPPDLAPLLAVAACPVRMATGEDDRMAPPEMLHAVTRRGTVVAGAGHNLHVEAPEAVLDLALSPSPDGGSGRVGG